VTAAMPRTNKNDDREQIPTHDPNLLANKNVKDAFTKPRVCVIGAGISGLSTAYILHCKGYEVTVYEEEDRAGGHALTKFSDTAKADVDLGFQVFNLTTYAHLVGLFEELKVEHEQSDMSFSMQSESCEWGSLTIFGIFAQARNVFNLKFWYMIAEIVKFKRAKFDVLESAEKEYWEMKTIGEYLSEKRYTKYFAEHYVKPMCAAIWSCNDEDAMAFPVKQLIQFWANHHLLEIFERPVWRVVKGRSKAYVEALEKALPKGTIKTGRHVHSVHRYFDEPSKLGKIKVKTSETKKAVTGEQTKEKFDHVVFACHAFQALAILNENTTEKELNVLSNFRTTRNEVVLHDDPKFMPKNKAAWASWNCKSVGKKNSSKDSVCVTYWVNLLQNLPKGSKDLFVTLNPTSEIDEERIEFKKKLGHPVFNEKAIRAQKDVMDMQGENNTWFVGAWLRYGFHEDGINSAVEMCEKLCKEKDVVPWMPRFDVYPKQSFVGSVFLSLFKTIASKWMPVNAKLTFTLPTGVDFSISGKRDKSKATPKEVRLTVFSENMFRESITRQDIGLGEAYMNNDFSGDVMAFLDLICSGHPSKTQPKKGLSAPTHNWLNPKEIVSSMLSIIGGAAEMAAHKALSNTKEGSKKNIEYHYDAGNAFYSLFLDDTLLYSSGVHLKNQDGTPKALNGDDPDYIDKLLYSSSANREMTFKEKEEHLEEAQYNKIDAMIARLDFKKTDTVLEIGCGWGQLAIRLATKIGCKVTGLTLSKEQAAEARARVARLKLSHLIDIKIQDYRDETGVYDKVISIEMLEAVGHEHLPTFFETVRNCLKPNGQCAIQVITIPDERYKQYCETTSDFIRAYIFPGGHLPSISAMKNASPNGLTLESYDDIGLHYAVTLRLWRERMLARKQEVLKLGYSKRFLRMYEFYFAYCEAAFKHGLIGDLQMTWKRDGTDLKTLKQKDSERSQTISQTQTQRTTLLVLVSILVGIFAFAIALSNKTARAKYVAFLVPYIQRKGGFHDRPLLTMAILLLALFSFRFRLKLTKERARARSTASERLAKLQQDDMQRLSTNDGFSK
jgi:cyclopropane-fatty-acyl-phospholipid synthase